MKKKILWMALAFLSMAAVPEAMTPVYTSNLVNETALAFNKNYTLDLNALGIDYISFTTNASSVTMNTATFTDGVVSTAAITVASVSNFTNNASTDGITVSATNIAGTAASDSLTVSGTTLQLLGAGATDQINISSFTMLTGSSITLNGTILVNGRDWFTVDTGSGTATSLASAISNVSGFSAVAVSTTIFSTATIKGVFGNTYVMTSSTPTAMAVATSPFSGGIDPVMKYAFITFNGRVLRQGTDWFSLGTTSDTAKSIANALFEVPGVTTSFAGAVAFATFTQVGSFANAYTLSSSSSGFLTVANSSFTGGVDPSMNNAFVTINGLKLRNGYDWFSTSLASETATSIALVLNSVSGIAAQASGSVVTTTATTPGAAGNSFTLTASTSALSVASANFTGGRDTATVTINGVILMAGRDFTAVATSTGIAVNISSAINNNATLINQVVTSTAANSIISATSTATGSATNYTLSTNLAGSLTLSAATFTGGATSSLTVGSGTTSRITVTNHGFGTGVPLLYTKSAGTSPANLVANTTYFAIVKDANNFQLASTLANSTSSVNIVISTQLATGGGSFTLAPLAITGITSWQFQFSNDNTNWFNIASSSFNFASPYTSTTTAQDLGLQDYRYLRMSVVGPTQGAIQLQVTGNGKHSNP